MKVFTGKTVLILKWWTCYVECKGDTENIVAFYASGTAVFDNIIIRKSNGSIKNLTVGEV